MTLIYTGSYNAPNPGLLRVQNINNGVLTARGAMPAKFYPSTSGSLFSNNRMAYIKDAGGGGGSQGVHDASARTALLRINAIGKSSTKVGLPSNTPLSFKSFDNNTRRDSLRRVRSGGSVAPKKKGAVYPPPPTIEDNINAIGTPLIKLFTTSSIPTSSISNLGSVPGIFTAAGAPVTTRPFLSTGINGLGFTADNGRLVSDITLSDLGLAGSFKQFSLSMWFRSTAYDASVAGKAILSLDSDGTTDYTRFGMRCYGAPNYKPSYALGFGGGGDVFDISAFTPNTWHHAVSTLDATTNTNNFKVYIDGNLFATTFVENYVLAPPTETFKIGELFTFTAGTAYSSAKFSWGPLRLYNKVLNPSEVATLYTEQFV